MAQTALFTSPMAKKKKVSARYKPNSYRVISNDAEVQYPEKSAPLFRLSDVNIVGQSHDVHPWQEHRHNQPNPVHLDFLRHDVALLNEPVCNVYTRETHPVQADWWPSRYSKNKLDTPPHTKDTTMRHDYGPLSKDNTGFSRHQSNPNKTPARGTIPVNFLHQANGDQTLLQEGLSFEHQYNSREDPSYPIRSRRQGAFVWNPMSPEKSEAFIKSASCSMKQSGASESPEDVNSQRNATQPCSIKTTPDPITSSPVAQPTPVTQPTPAKEPTDGGALVQQTRTPMFPDIHSTNQLASIDFM